MKRHGIIILAISGLTLLMGLVLMGVHPAPVPHPPSADGERVYLGEQACRQCHPNQFNKWRLTRHAKAYTSLSMPVAKEIAALSGIDVDPHESPICLGCHTTAFDVEEWELDETFYPEDGIQCEFCHGPGSGYSSEAIMQDPDRARKAGLKFPGEHTCMVCHAEKGSHTAVLEVRKFVYEEALKEIAHPGSAVVAMEASHAAEPVAGPQYVGAIVCGTCHGRTSPDKRIFSKWRASEHARAYAILGTERAREIAAEMGVEGNPQHAAECLKCHVTGGGEPSGKFAETFDPAHGVQCESCHGAGSDYMHDGVMRDPVAAAEAGLVDVEPSVCLTCHTENIHGHTFDYERMWPLINHSRWQIEEAALRYKTPFNLAVTRDGRRLFVVCEGSDEVLVVDPRSGSVLAEIPVGRQPHHVLLSGDEKRAYVANRGSDDVSVVDMTDYRVLSTFAVGDEPHEMATNPAGTILYVTNAGTYDISVVDLAAEKEIKRLAASRGPWGIAGSSDGRTLYVTNNLPRFSKFREPATSEVTVIETGRSTVRHRYQLLDANLIQGVAVAPDDSFAMVTLIRTKSLVPMTRNAQGWIITNGIGILWPDGRTDQLLLDRWDEGFADPTDIVITRDGRYAFVSGGGVREVAVIDIAAMKRLLEEATPEERAEVLPNHLGKSLEWVVKRIPVGESPRGMALSPDHRTLYVADGLDDAISVIDVRKLEKTGVIDLGGPEGITDTRYGQRLFHRADQTYARQFACHSCHPDGHIDGITYDIEADGLGVNPVDNRTLRGINDTAPFKWVGTNPTLKRQCGARLSAFFTRGDPYNAEQAAALDRYIVTISRPPNRYRPVGADLTTAQRRGKQLFERDYDKSNNLIPLQNRCYFCHPAPYYTNRGRFDIGSASPLDTQTRFDVPHLNNIYDSPPYMHDGKAHSLEEIWTLYNPYDTHGVTNDLTKDELNDLIEYLKTL